jgi:hypothetical protein
LRQTLFDTELGTFWILKLALRAFHFVPSINLRNRLNYKEKLCMGKQKIS